MFKQVGDEVMLIEEVITENQIATVMTHYCFATKLIILGSNTTTVNVQLPLIVSYRDWQDNLLQGENRPIHITVTGPGQAQELILTPVNGQAEFNFVSVVPGTFKIQVTAEFPCEPAEIEVVVS
ncbi:MAG: hypothetical protein ACPLRU_08985 [Desulfofundulus sp.]